MLRASVVPVVVLGVVLGLTGCGGGSGGAGVAGPTSTGTGSNVAGSLGGSAGVITGTSSGTNTGANAGAGSTASGTVDSDGAGTGTTSNAGSSTGSGTDTGQGGTGVGTGTSTSDTACPDLSRCIDFTALRIAKYKDNKQAAASYTFDDGYSSSSLIGSIFEKAGLRATFYIIPGIVSDDGWSMWRALASKGHEIGNHSMTHPDFVNTVMTDQQLDTEINGAQKLIEQKLGVRPQTFAFPYHLYTDRALKVAQQNHVAVRKMNLGDAGYQFAFFDTDHGTDIAGTLMTVNRQLDEVVKAGGWFVAGGHGVDGDGWSPVTTDFLQKHLTYAAQYSSTLWTDTFANVARYGLCRDTVKAEALLQSSTQAYVRLTGPYDAAVCNAPLTVTVPVSIPSGATLRATAADGTDVPIRVGAGTALFNLRPGDKVSLQVVSAEKYMAT
jgi:peptidoglycan/xylan/chitin deacetylase (PgdA/CDA1 family)